MTLPSVPPRPSPNDAFRIFENIAATYGVPRDELVQLVGAAQATEWHVGWYAGYQVGRRDGSLDAAPSFEKVVQSAMGLVSAEVQATLDEFDANRAPRIDDPRDREAMLDRIREQNEKRRAECEHVWPHTLGSPDTECIKGCGATFGLWSEQEVDPDPKPGGGLAGDVAQQLMFTIDHDHGVRHGEECDDCTHTDPCGCPAGECDCDGREL